MIRQKAETSVLIVDDHRLMREGLKSNLSQFTDISDIHQAGNGLDAVRMAMELKPDVILMDINLPDLNGMEATRQILAQTPDTKILALTMHTDKVYVMGMMKAGAAGFLTKTCSARELYKAIQRISSDKAYICDEVIDIVLETAVNPDLSALGQEKELTRRESQILKLISEGNTNHEIADILCISNRTVEKHRKSVMDKLGIRTVAQLTKYALKKGLTFID
ncbi:MAG TPA: DNA-binding response regulator [Desulfobacteraceae bacterium]|nr:DNA-binding response regulator [Desulfobacteraceae bacterium]|tara:strand:+ start:220 stop:882 length:663 start_codon:yes stop_codon:yes gene_type:complete